MPRAKVSTTKPAKKKRKLHVPLESAGPVKRRALHIPLDDTGLLKRHLKLTEGLEIAARATIEAGFTREIALERLDQIMIRMAMEEFDNKDTHMAALLLGVSDQFVNARWKGLEWKALVASDAARLRAVQKSPK